jgi:1,4-dihydroxy-2-naphthoyl-CoA hydrolase
MTTFRLQNEHEKSEGNLSMHTVDQVADAWRGTFSSLLGINFLEVRKDLVVAELEIRDELRTIGGALHGGSLMAFADTIGAVGAIANLPAGSTTSTLESKTNFLGAGRGGLVRAAATPVHIGRRTMVWQTKITDQNSRLLALTTQTQMVFS